MNPRKGIGTLIIFLGAYEERVWEKGMNPRKGIGTPASLFLYLLTFLGERNESSKGDWNLLRQASNALPFLGERNESSKGDCNYPFPQCYLVLY